MIVKEGIKKQIRELENEEAFLQSEIDCHGKITDRDELRRVRHLLKTLKTTQKDLFDKTYKVFIKYMMEGSVALNPVAVTRDQAYKIHKYATDLVIKDNVAQANAEAAESAKEGEIPG